MTIPSPQVLKPAYEALRRMKRAYDRGTGCNLTDEMIQSLYLTVIGQMWGQEEEPEFENSS